MTDVAELARGLMQSTCIFVSKRIPHTADSAAYIKAMRRCYYICSEEANGSNLQQMHKDLLKVRTEAHKQFCSRFELLSDVKKHYIMGVDHCIDIVRVIRLRFDTGHSYPDDIFIKNILGRDHEDQI
jgi:hypothetical protein